MGAAADKLGTRVLPTHFVTLWMADLPLRHGDRFGDLGIGIAWTLGAMLLAFTVVVATVRIRRQRRVSTRPGSVTDQLAAATRMGWREWRRNPVLWLLPAAVPAVFILTAQAITPHRPTAIVVTEGGSGPPESLRMVMSSRACQKLYKLIYVSRGLCWGQASVRVLGLPLWCWCR
jgi:hypothetical protein